MGQDSMTVSFTTSLTPKQLNGIHFTCAFPFVTCQIVSCKKSSLNLRKDATENWSQWQSSLRDHIQNLSVFIFEHLSECVTCALHCVLVKTQWSGAKKKYFCQQYPNSMCDILQMWKLLLCDITAVSQDKKWRWFISVSNWNRLLEWSQLLCVGLGYKVKRDESKSEWVCDFWKRSSLHMLWELKTVPKKTDSSFRSTPA